ncbi:MAG: cytochrome c maturation protein CcmE [Nevskia sp.]|jgi:cytochrome c-type biogenesis protein CcmE|nr:cytochrome c maturation protein CcmE [Nevskia sp.]MCK9384579.1 cytochrome c maturation protein CcmE [Nevskia sp.]
MTKRQKRIYAVAGLVVGVGVAAALGFTAFRKNMMYFYTPSDLIAGDVPVGANLELGGLVEKGSLVRAEGLKIQFSVADCAKAVPVRYEGVVPDLFREGQGVVATGHMGDDHVFVATRILAKHDENYMPPRVAESLKSEDGKHSCAPFKSVAANAG